ncbi:MAG: DNA-3-methyladenine glycosylase [Pseudomonadota bacterium]
MEKLDRNFYLLDTLTVARELLGKELVHVVDGFTVAGRIVETEAYIGPEDKGSHSFGGRRTERNEVMYRIGGTSYVYLIYGMHHCFNVVTGPEGKPEAVLIRAVEPIIGAEHMSLLRYGMELETLSERKKAELCNGPGKLCRAMGIGKKENGADLCGDSLFLRTPQTSQAFVIKSSPRINIDYAGEYKDKPWRFFVEGSRYVSKR